MGQYRIVAAKPKGETNHCNSSFKTYEYASTENTYKLIGWKSLAQITALIAAGHVVRTGKIENGSMADGASVEAELRIAKNGTRFKISEMPDA